MPRKDNKQRQEEVEQAYQSGNLFRPLDNVRDEAPPLIPLWGDFLFRSGITWVCGDPGVCKTTWGYGLGMALCCKQPFLGIEAEEDVSLLYADFESSDALIGSRARMISKNSTPNFYIFNHSEYTLPDIAVTAIHFVRQNGINLLMVDNQSFAFDTHDENDNPEAIRQLKFVRQLTVECNMATLVFHHSNKANAKGTRKGSGAFARARAVDVMVNLDDIGQDTIRMSVVKNRFTGAHPEFFFKKAEGQFIFCDPPTGYTGAGNNTYTYQVIKRVQQILADGEEHRYKDILDAMTDEGFPPDIVQYAVKKLGRENRVMRPRYGYYQKRTK